jgi:hypothetical protein
LQSYIITPNNYPHDIENSSRLLKNDFDTLSLDHSIIEPIAIHWFSSRRELNLDPVQKIFLAEKFDHILKDSGLPKFWDSTKFNLVFFVSSQNELGSIEENIKAAPFDQTDVIKILYKEFPDIHYTIRVHPNLKNKDSEFLSSIESRKELRNVKVIPAESPLNSYSLLDAADLILTFGSTMGVEAAFKIKPVVNIGVAPYLAFDCVAICNSKEDVLQLVGAAKGGDFSKFPSVEKRYRGACAYAYAYLNQGVPAKYIEKDSYFGGYMLRDGRRTKIKADESIILTNRIFGFFPRAYYLVHLLLKNPDMLKKINLSNFIRKFKHTFFGEMP